VFYYKYRHALSLIMLSYAGLSWLWRTWQETSPGRPRQQQQQPVLQQQQQQQQSNDDLNFDDEVGQSNAGGGGSGLNYPSNNQSVGWSSIFFFLMLQ
jgi:ABC-type nickel/cobalt efflux system permease component RcnA